MVLGTIRARLWEGREGRGCGRGGFRGRRLGRLERLAADAARPPFCAHCIYVAHVLLENFVGLRALCFFSICSQGAFQSLHIEPICGSRKGRVAREVVKLVRDALLGVYAAVDTWNRYIPPTLLLPKIAQCHGPRSRLLLRAGSDGKLSVVGEIHVEAHVVQPRGHR